MVQIQNGGNMIQGELLCQMLERVRVLVPIASQNQGGLTDDDAVAVMCARLTLQGIRLGIEEFLQADDLSSRQVQAARQLWKAANVNDEPEPWEEETPAHPSRQRPSALRGHPG